MHKSVFISDDELIGIGMQNWLCLFQRMFDWYSYSEDVGYLGSRPRSYVVKSRRSNLN